MIMFSINPAYDYSTGTYGIGSAEVRGKLYRECEKEGIGISVMKPFGGGQLLNAKTSPFKKSIDQKPVHSICT
jgi:predicted aldo/keto reductase-like oxidoreductase